MLKSITLQLPGRDFDPLTLTELPALVVDRIARAALTAIGAPLEGGIVGLALQHQALLLKDSEQAVALLEPLVQASRPVRSWQNVLAVQQAAMALHVGFLVGRPRVEIPVRMQGETITQDDDLGVHFCSPQIAAVLHSGRASYRELETVLSTEDVYNLVELLNVESVREWRAHQTTGPQR